MQMPSNSKKIYKTRMTEKTEQGCRILHTKQKSRKDHKNPFGKIKHANSAV